MSDAANTPMVTLEEDPIDVSRLPLAIGLALGACVSLTLWGLIGLGLRALSA